MKINILISVVIALIFAGCGQNNADSSHSHVGSEDGHIHETPTLNYTVYTNNFELFAVFEPMVLGKENEVLVHLSLIPEFTPVTRGETKLTLNVGGAESRQTVNGPQQPGIYRFSIKPRKAGLGTMKLEVLQQGNTHVIEMKDIMVYGDEHAAEHAADNLTIEDVNTIAFSKEQSWKIEFETQLPLVEPMGQVLKTTAQIQSTPQDEVIITAGLNGLIAMLDNGILEGREVKKGELLLNISGDDLIDNNSEVKFIEAKSDYELTFNAYERSKELATDKIISEKELQKAKNNFEKAKVIFDNVKESFNSSGQSVVSPVDGYIKQLLVKNGQYVSLGESVISISRNESLFLHADVQQKYHHVLDEIVSANIMSLYDNKVYTLEGLNGKIISYGKTTNIHNFLIPISLEIDYIEGFMPGSFVELYLKTITSEKAITVPNSSLLENQGNFFVFVQVNPELFELREVKIGTTDGIKTEILSGLNSDERIVTKGATLIKLAKSSGGLDAHSGHVH